MSEIGKVIQNLREEAGVSQEELAAGLCSDSTLSRIEWGERLVGQWRIDAFLQRLGKSADKFWTIINIRDYEILEKRRVLWEDILCGRYEEAVKHMADYKAMLDVQEPVQRQYFLMCQGLYAGKAEQDWQKSKELLQKAVDVTILDFRVERVADILIGRDEMLLILLLAQAYEQLGEEETAREIAFGLLQNIESRRWDEEENVKIYPKIVRYCIEFLKKEDKYEKVVTLSKKAVELLCDNSVIYLLAELMECQMWGMERRIQVEGRGFSPKEQYEYVQLKRHSEVLKELWEEYGDISAENMMYCTNTQKDISISNEVLKKCRKLSKMSQEELSVEICSAENLSRIENGRISPQEKNFRSLMEKMNQAIERDRGIIDSSEFELHEQMRKVSKYVSDGEYRKADEVWKTLREKIPKNTEKNQQCIIRMDTAIKNGNQIISWKEAKERYEEALALTMPEFQKIDITKWPFSRTEMFLLNNVAIGYYEDGRKAEARRIFYKLKESFEKSKVDVHYRMTEYVFLLYNMGVLETCDGHYEQACEYFEKGMRMEVKKGRFNMIPEFLWGLENVMEVMKMKDNKKARHMIQQAYFLCNILNAPNKSNDIQKYYWEQWNERIEY